MFGDMKYHKMSLKLKSDAVFYTYNINCVTISGNCSYSSKNLIPVGVPVSFLYCT